MTNPYVVTGAASGIGLAVVEELVARGAPVIGLDRRDSSRPGVSSIVVDLADPTSIGQAIDQLPAEIAGLANVAGLPGTADAATVLAVNFFAVKLLSRGLTDRIQHGGAVVNVSSIAAHRSTLDQSAITALAAVENPAQLESWLVDNPLEGPAAYDTSKRVLNQYTIALAASLVGSHRRALTISPGPIETPILADFRASMGEDSIDRAAQAVGRHGRPEEIAAAIVFALSPEASWINGIDIPVEGGISAVRAAAAVGGDS